MPDQQIKRRSLHSLITFAIIVIGGDPPDRLRGPARRLTKSEVRSQKFLTAFRRDRTEVVFETEIYAPSQKLWVP